jgi:CO/xanthine dehydrogenase FAD-binding subunit
VQSTLSHRQWHRPKSLAEALRRLRAHEGLVPVAGCTDLYVSLNFGTLDADRFLDLWRLDELRRIEMRKDILSIGALATFTDIIRSPAVRARLPMLVSAAREIGGVQIQNRATIGGNVGNGSPAGDSLPVLAAADAIVVLRSADAVRRVPLTEFYTGYRRSVRQPDELIVGFEVAPIRGRQFFRKVGTRAAQSISKVVMAGVAGRVPALAFGSVAPTVLRARRAEAALASDAPVEEAQRALEADIAPVDDLRSTAHYRQRVAANLLARFVRETGGRLVSR